MEPRQIPKNTRLIMVQEIEHWQREGLIHDSLAASLKKKYDFDFAPPPPVEPPTLKPEPVPPPQPPKPRQTLAQMIFSESFIRIALYLGAFFVIAASLILAALVEALRLPILSIVAVLFAGGALVLKRRLPQPSFILYLVFSALLPIIASVLRDQLNLSGDQAYIFWAIVLAVMAFLWAFSTWLYKSRLFSMAALLALDISLVMVWSTAHPAPVVTANYTYRPSPPFALLLLLLVVSSLVGLGGAILMKRLLDKELSQSLFILTQVQHGVILFAAVIHLVILLWNQDYSWGWLAALTWLLIAVFAILSNQQKPRVLYPWIASAALMPVPWLIVAQWNSEPVAAAIVFGVWGVFLSICAEVLYRIRMTRQTYALPLSVTAVLLLLIGGIQGMEIELWMGLVLFLGSGILLAVLHVIHSRKWIWAVAIGCLLTAYFTLFQLPFAAQISDHLAPQLTGAALLLLLPDLALSISKQLPNWRWPLRGWAVLAGSAALIYGISTYINLSWLESMQQKTWPILVSFGVLSLLYLAYAVRLRQPWISALFTLHTAICLTMTLDYFDVQAWLPILVALAAGYYLVGFLLLKKKPSLWTSIFRSSGLILAGVLCVAALFDDLNGRGWFVLIPGLLFLVELLQNPWFEMVPPLIFSMALGVLLADAGIKELYYYSFGFSILFLGLDLLYTRLKDRMYLKWATRMLGGAAVLLTPILVCIPDFMPAPGALLSLGLTILLVIIALVYRQPNLGYGVTLFFSLAALFASLHFYENRWVWALIACAVLFYGLGFLFSRLKTPEWGTVLFYSGLVVGTFTAISTPFEEPGLIASLPVALAASLWAVEAFRQRNVWLGFPSTLLYLMAYFMILFRLDVDQPQFYTVGAAILGMLMHYLLVRTGSKTGAFLTGMLSQFVLIGTSYIQFVDTEDLMYFLFMFIQSLIVLGYGIAIRSRSLVITPLALVILGVVTVVFGVLRGYSTVLLIGGTGIGLIFLGIAALLLRERISNLRTQLKDWRA